jgi:hypothetical protein
MQFIKSIIIATSFCLIFVPKPVFAQDDLSIWPNRVSSANSDDWLIKNHDKIKQMRPRLLVLNFVNGLSEEKARAKVEGLIAALRESSRYHGFEYPKAPPFLDYQIAKFVDLTDATSPAEKLDGNSSKYPRVPNWKEDINFQYGRLFKSEFTEYYGMPSPTRKQRLLSLYELVNYGYINEVWFLAIQGKYGSPFESIEVKQAYDAQLRKLPGKWVQAGNGGTDEQPFIGRSLRILFINAERGPGCAMESLGHSLEGMSRSNAIPYLKPYFEEYAGFDMKKRFGTPFDNLYERDGNEMSYPNPNTMTFKWKGEERTINNYVPVANNVHFMPNGRRDYDLDNPSPILTTMEHYRMRDGSGGKDTVTLYTPKVLDQYRQLANDCMGRWVVFWRQNMPGLNNRSKDDSGKPMKNWWPFLFY